MAWPPRFEAPVPADQGAPLDLVLGLGSNLGDRVARLDFAVARLSEIATIVAVSSLYETAPVGPPQPHFLNAAVRLAWPRAAHELLSATLEIERLAGRERRERWGPRTLDLDLLWIRGRCVDAEKLTVPHPRLHERPFALLPLLEVAPDAADPRTGALYATIAAALDRSGVRQLATNEFRWLARPPAP
ncbi:MAG TPA: 2-amino-4-hydroxy-6-hydroxymethyldihydropteridine diphosphokinase [Polyangiaceae bacterium]|jgi:2-amino-4-hydroxy-6-hydroxymethyldihydropteridine diphosphokinase|nr:2-amino-4-hydroxy-6-hydroxymethyldihydropteridine diphosphokinase [Polyangiaceae bacterium]